MKLSIRSFFREMSLSNQKLPLHPTNIKYCIMMYVPVLRVLQGFQWVLVVHLVPEVLSLHALPVVLGLQEVPSLQRRRMST